MPADDYTNFPPGTHMLDNQNKGNDKQDIILNPTPSDDPDDPLNWTTLRKTVNFGLTCTYVFLTFVLLDIGAVAYGKYEGDLGLSLGTITQSSGASYAGLALGCLFTVPCVHKFGRRPLYLISATIQLICAICEAIVMITIVDLFFVHQHARMNGIFLFMQSLGTLGGPIAGGYIIVKMQPQWRWMWWIVAICLAANLLLVLFFFEESKFVPRTKLGYSKISKRYENSNTNDISSTDSGELSHGSDEPLYDSSGDSESQAYPRKSYLERLALVTKTDGPILQNFYRPLFVPFVFPAVIFTAVQYGMIQSWFTATTTAGSEYLKKPPYNFQSNDIGLFNLGGFIGCLLATFTITFLSDWLVVQQARRNNGVFEPEMRLWLLFPAILLNSVGSWIFGIGLAQGWHWMVLAVGNGIFGFGFMVTADVSLTYLTDCYPLILNDALVGVVFIRNVFSMIVKFPFAKWLEAMGVQNTFIMIGAISFATMIVPGLFMIWGKRFRTRTSLKYTEYAAYQQSQRPEPQH
ncbi:Major facilitator superfamily domain general substrate transporter [Penicillium citrinum]|uniref:Major facilitator superfamily domain general substrate transporter n=1 Tax=Penicillium citrinum TaxID=5077 RepID=A0A9W9TL81_PENCI|nr:Major facilitator superfamily domain general substrate transporter [Penicillium citrinum]KAJ5226654.1 Major facilitator superfamily domain general substrate transporter [Penicillium citrinum]